MTVLEPADRVVAHRKQLPGFPIHLPIPPNAVPTMHLVLLYAVIPKDNSSFMPAARHLCAAV